MRRRDFVTLFTGAVVAGPHVATAQTSSKVYRLGTLTPGLPRDESSDGATLLRVLSERGYALGKNLSFYARGSMGQVSRVPQIVEEMKAANVDVILTIGYPSALAARASGVPVVIASGSGDPVATGLVNSLMKSSSSGLRECAEWIKQ